MNDLLLYRLRLMPSLANGVPDRREGGRAGAIIQIDKGLVAFHRRHAHPATDQSLPEFRQQFSPGVLLQFIVIQNLSGRLLFSDRVLESGLSELLDQPQCLCERDDVDDGGRARLELVRGFGPDDPTG